MVPGPTKCPSGGRERHREVRRRSSQELDISGSQFASSPQSKVDTFLFYSKGSNLSLSVPVLPKWSLAPGEGSFKYLPIKDSLIWSKCWDLRSLEHVAGGGDHLLFVSWRIGVAPSGQMFRKKKALLMCWHVVKTCKEKSAIIVLSFSSLCTGNTVAFNNLPCYA